MISVFLIVGYPQYFQRYIGWLFNLERVSDDQYRGALLFRD
jgi:hypothetical protein